MTDMEIAVGLMEEGSSSSDGASGRPVRTSEDFFKFVTYVLEYAKYVAENNEDNNRNMANQSPPTVNSNSNANDNGESIVNSLSINLRKIEEQHRQNKVSQDAYDDSGADEEDEETLDDIRDEDDDPDDKVTCYCQKPFAGRPMIECSLCLSWIHLSCAKIRKNNIPDVFHCAICKGNKRPASPSPTSHSTPGVKRAKKSMSGVGTGQAKPGPKEKAPLPKTVMAICDYKTTNNVLSGTLKSVPVPQGGFSMDLSSANNNFVLVDPRAFETIPSLANCLVRVRLPDS